MQPYKHKLKPFARSLRQQQTRPEQILWGYLRKKRIRNVQFYRQKPLGTYIVDFYAPSEKLIIELDGVQHYYAVQLERDEKRDAYFNRKDLRVLRFNNLEVLAALEMVLGVITDTIDGKPVWHEHGKFIDLGWGLGQ